MCESIVFFVSSLLNSGEVVADHLCETRSSVSQGQTLRLLRGLVAFCVTLLMANVIKLVSFLNQTFRFDFDNAVFQIQMAELLLGIHSSIDCVAITCRGYLRPHCLAR